MKLWFLSDQHGGEAVGELPRYLENAGTNDLLFCLGDTGLHFYQTEAGERFTREFLAAEKNIALLDGNHEDFDYLWSFPQEDWCGGRVYRLSPHIVLLQRGNIYTVNGKTFFVMGGCRSSAKWVQNGPWSPKEEPGEEDLARAYENLRKYGNRVDYILTHRYARRGDEKYEDTALQRLFDFMEDEVTFTHWYAGHWHQTNRRDETHTIVYDRLVPLE